MQEAPAIEAHLSALPEDPDERQNAVTPAVERMATIAAPPRARSARESTGASPSLGSSRSGALVISVMGLVLGLGVGVGTVLTLDLLDSSIRSDRDISDLLGLPVLGTIDKIETPAERVKARRTARAATVGILALFFLTATALFVQVSSDGDVGSLMVRVLEMFG